MKRKNENLTEKEIDDLVVRHADDDNTWEKPIFVNRKRTFSILPPIYISEDILNGEPVFEGTRVPVAALLDNFEAGVSLDEFLENFPTVKRQKAIQVLEYFKSTLDKIKWTE